MAIRVECVCGRRLVAADYLAGKKAKCPSCDQLIRLPQPAEEIDKALGWNGTSDHGIELSEETQSLLVRPSLHRPPDTYEDWVALKESGKKLIPDHLIKTGKSNSSQSFAEIRRYLMRAIGIIGAIWWLLTFHAPSPSLQVLVHYLCLFVFAAYVAIEATNRVEQCRRWRFLLAIPFAITVCWIWRHYDSFEREWDSDTETRYVDSYLRSGKHWHRRLMMKNSRGSYILGYSSEGPMAGSPPRPHGHWRSMMWEPTFGERHHWYWYGDDITQGEWELRNK